MSFQFTTPPPSSTRSFLSTTVGLEEIPFPHDAQTPLARKIISNTALEALVAQCDGTQIMQTEERQISQQSSTTVTHTSHSLLNKTAACSLGTPFHFKEGIQQDFREAARLFELATKQGDSTAAHNLAVMYATGKGMAQDIRRAVELLTPIQHLNPESQILLALLLEDENSPLHDMKRAIELYESAAQKNHPIAMFRLAYLKERGKGVPQNLPEAKLLYTRSILEGNLHAPIALALLLMEESKDIAIENDIHRVLERPSDNDFFSQRILSLINSVGVAHGDTALVQLLRECLEDFFSPTFWLRAQKELRFIDAIVNRCVMASAQGSAIAPFVLGGLCLNDLNHVAAFSYYHVSAGRGYTPAKVRLGRAYAQGLGVPQDFAKAIELLRQAASQNNALAWYLLGQIYQDVGEDLPEFPKDLLPMVSLDLPKDLNISVGAYHHAATLGLPDAMKELSSLYHDGAIFDGIPNEEESRLWQKCAEHLCELPKLGWVLEDSEEDSE